MSGKGSGRRPQQVPDESVQDAWSRIFGKPRKAIKTQEEFTEWLKESIKDKSDVPDTGRTEQTTKGRE